MKYTGAMITLQEVPGEVSLTFSISGCPFRCLYCHSPQLRKDIGIVLDETEFNRLLDQHISKHTGLSIITCVCFLGGDQFPLDIIPLLKICEQRNLKTCIYTGNTKIDPTILPYLTYLKTGPYIEELGPLTKHTTNQKFIRVSDNADLTSQFWSS